MCHAGSYCYICARKETAARAPARARAGARHPRAATPPATTGLLFSLLWQLFFPPR